MTTIDVVLMVVAGVALLGAFVPELPPMRARSWQLPQPVHCRPAARPDKFPIPPGKHPKAQAQPNYREAAPLSVADEIRALKYRMDALERAEVERTLREMTADSASVVAGDAGPARWWCTRVHMDPSFCGPDCPGRREGMEAAKRAADADVDEFERATSEGAKR